jgi:hypothetical protein
MSSASNASPSPHPKPWEEKNPWIAGILAYLIPGAGHFYQGRTAKGLIYSISILGLFFWGQKLGEGMVVYNRPDTHGAMRHVALSYAAQLGVGASALPALVQNYRASQPINRIVKRLSTPFSAEFQGTLNPSESAEGGRLEGTVRLEPVEGQFGPEVRGTFEGTLDGKSAKLVLGGRFELDRAIKAGFRRRLECGVVDDDRAANPVPRWIGGTVARSIIDAYGSPPEPEQLQEINGRLGKLYELALVFTWIAGLLNVLAIWDCILGPAYGFGDEVSAKPPEMKSGEVKTAPAATVATPTSTASTTPAAAPSGKGTEGPPLAESGSQKSPA